MSVTAVSPTKQTILTLLDKLPPESLTTVETFVRFVYDQTQQGQPVMTAPSESPQSRPFKAKVLHGKIQPIDTSGLSPIAVVNVERPATELPESPRFRFPTVPVPASSLDRLIGLMTEVEGDALADTEALYDEV
jgi:hypothetical protein